MRLTEKQNRFYQDNGYLFLAEVFSPREISEMQQVLPVVFAKDDPARVLEKDGHTVRSVYGCHTTTEVFSRLVRDSRLLEPAEDLIGSQLYVYQFKLNVKRRLVATCGNGIRITSFGGKGTVWQNRTPLRS